MNIRGFWILFLLLTLVLASIAVVADSQVEEWAEKQLHEKLTDEHTWVSAALRMETKSGAVPRALEQLSRALPNRTLQLHSLEGERLWPPDSSEGFRPFPVQAGEMNTLTLHRRGEAIWGLLSRPVVLEGQERIVSVGAPAATLATFQGTIRLVLLGGIASILLIGWLLARTSSLLTYNKLRKMLQQVRPIARALAKRPDATPKSEEMATIAKSVRKLARNLEEAVEVITDERNRFSAVLEGMKTGVLALNGEQRILLANPSAQRILSSQEPLVGSRLIDSWRSPAIHDLIAEAGGSGSAVGDIQLTSPVRRVLRVHATTTPDGMVLVLDEITQLRALETMRRDFVANVSHELRTPVSVIRANAETLLGGALQDEKSGPLFTEAILRNANRLTRLITDLLDLAQLESGKYAVSQVQFDLGESLDLALDALRPKAISKGMDLHIEVDPNHLVWGDPQSAAQVLSNYIDNAIKYTQEGGQITVRSHSESEAVRIEVEDNGPGIEPRHHDRLFERFYRVDTGRSRDLGGTGLGLAIVKHLARAMGGRVGIRSGTPTGSTFWLELPAGPREFKTLVSRDLDEDSEEE